MMMSRSGSALSSTISWAMMSSAEASSTCAPEEDDAVLEELVVRVLALVAVGRALLELGDDVAAGGHPGLVGHAGLLVGVVAVGCGPASDGRAAAAGHLAGGLDDVVDEPVLERLGRGEPAVAVGVLGDLLDGLAGLLRR